MTMASSVSHFLADHAVHYRVIDHAHSSNSRETAREAGVRADRVAKGVLLQDQEGALMAVLPASSSLDMRAVHEITGRNHLKMIPEPDLHSLLPDCATGAVPPLGQAYGLTTIVDSALEERNSVYLEAGDHTSLIELHGQDFDHIMAGSRHANLSRDWW